MRLVVVEALEPPDLARPLADYKTYSSYIPLMAYTFNSLSYSAQFSQFPSSSSSSFLDRGWGSFTCWSIWMHIRAPLSLSTQPQERRNFHSFSSSAQNFFSLSVSLSFTHLLNSTSILFYELGICGDHHRSSCRSLDVGFVSLGSSSGDFTPCVLIETLWSLILYFSF
jgi:hypothetical protein